MHQRDPVVVELEDDDDDVGDDVERRVSSHSAQEPIVEHPDDDVRPGVPHAFLPTMSVQLRHKLC